MDQNKDKKGVLPINVPKWRDETVSALKGLKTKFNKVAPKGFIKKLNELIHEAATAG
jgi:hypothetical protein